MDYYIQVENSLYDSVYSFSQVMTYIKELILKYTFMQNPQLLTKQHA